MTLALTLWQPWADADREALHGRVTELQDDLSGTRTSLRRVIKEQSSSSEPR